jgi:hypothetical protein
MRMSWAKTLNPKVSVLGAPAGSDAPPPAVPSPGRPGRAKPAPQRRKQLGERTLEGDVNWDGGETHPRFTATKSAATAARSRRARDMPRSQDRRGQFVAGPAAPGRAPQDEPNVAERARKLRCAGMDGAADELTRGTCTSPLARHGTARHGMAWHGTARHGMAWHGMGLQPDVERWPRSILGCSCSA